MTVVKRSPFLILFRVLSLQQQRTRLLQCDQPPSTQESSQSHASRRCVWVSGDLSLRFPQLTLVVVVLFIDWGLLEEFFSQLCSSVELLILF